MARLPFQILVFLHHRDPGGTFWYAVFHRADRDVWQGIAGGGEGDESPEQAARREALEESGVDANAAMIPLSSRGEVPVTEFHANTEWPTNLKTIPEFAFAIPATPESIRLSREHTAVDWLTFQDAAQRLEWTSNRRALAELSAILTSAR